MDNFKLSQSTIEKLGYYVYLLVDPKNEKIFYVGKGKGNRINQHLFGEYHENSSREKDLIIKKIQKSGKQVKQIILRHGLTESESLEVESSIIDLLGKENLTNIVKGHNSEDHGKMNLKDLKIKYEAENLVIGEPIMLINVNSLYERGMSKEKLYEITRKSWRINLDNANKIRIVCATYRGIIRGVFLVDKWIESSEVNGRYMFIGKHAKGKLKEKYIHKSVMKYIKKGNQNPIKYLEI
jgi:uncharacterized protein